MRSKALRGILLDFLKQIYPKEIELIGLYGVFYERHTVDAINKALGYLVDKGYVEEKIVPNPYRRYKCYKLYKLTPKGLDLLEGTINDPGIFVPIEEEE